jgi:CxC2 like cysteine cluster associated with KDZ transposases
MLEWLPSRQEFLAKLAELEAPPEDMICSCCKKADGCIRCKDCLTGGMICKSCCLLYHKQLPFHRLERWKDGFFQKTSLYKEGYILYLGHGGEPCPTPALPEFDDYMDQASRPKLTEDVTNMLDGWEDVHSDIVMVLVDTSGVHHHVVSWCHCTGALERHLQLVQSRLYPGSLTRPETAFTFDVLEYFHIDAVECKTSALNFFAKLRRLSNYMVPDSVPVIIIIPGGHQVNI